MMPMMGGGPPKAVKRAPVAKKSSKPPAKAKSTGGKPKGKAASKPRMPKMPGPIGASGFGAPGGALGRVTPPPIPGMPPGAPTIGRPPPGRGRPF
jgi:hypothetical protein